mmetsp:Transcript_22769/g.37714  ORF Transcript_22769/g.37714 Transcript_22769/m.37714 type:complete len:619 (-) Transcript_22769:63-1919(-)
MEEAQQLSTSQQQKEPNYQYNKNQYHPIEEYLVTATEKLTSDTPSFVLEVTWPRVALFYHPASPLCIQLRDRYVAVAREIRRRSIRAPVEFWAISCEVHRDACEDLGVTAVPRILAFPAGKIDGILVPRTNDNGIEVAKIIDILSVHLKDVDEDEAEADNKSDLDEDNAKMREIEQRAKAANDPYQMHVGEVDHMQEILHPHSALSDVYADAMASLLHSIDGATKKDDTGYVEAWSWDQYHAFREWLDLMHWSLPTRDMAKVHNVINDLRNNIQAIENRPDEVTRILESHDYFKTDPKWSSSCQASNKNDKGYACGFWKLLHIVSIGVVEQHSSVMGDLQRVVVPHITTTIRDYVQFFDFASSEDGSELLLQAFEDCFGDTECQSGMGIRKKGLFARFRRRNIPAKTDKSWKELSIFLWKIHQAYRSKRVSRTQDGYDSLLNVEELQWPPSALCPMCYSTQGMPKMVDGKFRGVHENLVVDTLNQIMWNKDKVFQHLKHEYWPRSLQTPRVVVLDRWDRKQLKDALHQGEWGIWSIVCILVTLLVCGAAILSVAKAKRPRPRSNQRRKRGFGLPRGSFEREELLDSDSVSRRAHFQPRRRTNGRVQGFKSGSSPFLDD